MSGENLENPIQISNVSNKLYFVCSYCSKVCDTINILNKCSTCEKSFCANCLIKNNEKYACKMCDGLEYKIKCSNCGNAAKNKVCYLCLNTICEKCTNEIDCICKEGLICDNCKPKKKTQTNIGRIECENCGTILCGPKCSKRKCFMCNKGCDTCLVTCDDCKKMRCFECDKLHLSFPCNDCKESPTLRKPTKESKCIFCSFCYNNYCEKCLITCTCCLTTSCKTCYKNHTANSDKCEFCDKLLCCNECVNTEHDFFDCPLCNENVMCKKIYKISCSVNDCDVSSHIELCCCCNIKKINFDFISTTECCNKILCNTHLQNHKCSTKS